MSDHGIRQSVVDALRFEPSIDDTHIGVAVAQGVVTLSGYVTDFMQKLAAERATWSVPGVKAIVPELVVQLKAFHKTTDEEIAQRASSILAWHAWLAPAKIKVSVLDGLVTLGGSVNWNFTRKAAEHAIRKLAGVKGVLNLITLNQHASATEIEQNLRSALERNAPDACKHIEVTVMDDGLVRLQGEVDSRDAQQIVERAVWATAGVRAIEDDLRIRP